MAHRSIWGPDPYEQRSQGRGRSLSPNGGKELHPQETREDDTKENVAGLGPTLAASRVRDSSAELALDFVLNDIAEQALVSTLATGAIIALRHGDELICRAVAGDSRAQLGMRLDTHSGLCGDCVETGEPQFCDDTEADARIEAQASRLLGIRSIVALPIIDGKKLLGIFELSWPRPHAVREPEVRKLQSLCAVIVNKLGGAAPKTVVPSSTGDPLMTAASAKNFERVAEPAIKAPKSSFDPTASLEKVAPSEQSEQEDDLWPWEIEAREKVKSSLESRDSRRQETPAFQLTPVLKDTDGNGSGKRGRDYWTSILTAVVIALALLLGWMVGRAGWEMAVDKASERTPAMTPEAPVEEPTASRSPTDVESKKPADVGSRKAKAKLDSDVPLAPVGSDTTAAAINSKASSTPAAHEVSAGGLVVYEKGKVVFKMPPSGKSSPPANSSTAAGGSAEQNASDASAPLRVSSDAVNSYLLQRVEPEYPEPAKLQHIEGAVVLGILVGSDGTVKSLSIESGDLQLVNAATDAVRQWRFKPYLLNGKAVEFETRVTVNFALP
jgi:TonB family protein